MAFLSKTSDKSKQKSGSIKNYFKGVRTELKKVHWPNKELVGKYTLTVLVTVAGASIVIFLVDTVLSSGMQALFKLFS